MPKKEYDWSQGPAELAPHSLAKHTILREYIEQYVSILTKSGKAPRLRITLIDGFAGGGEYVLKGSGKIHDGSPLILIKAVQSAEARINEKRNKPFDVNADYFFIEEEKSAFTYLKDALKRHVDEKFLNDNVKMIHGSFEDHVWDIVRTIKSARPKSRPIFVLDQYGYKKIPVDMIARIMKEIENSEIFLTLAVDHISAYAESLTGALDRVRSALHIDPNFDKILSGRLDADGLGELSEDDRNQMLRCVQLVLHEAFATKAGAACYTPFFITSRGSNRSYWFLHLANSPRANDVVKDLHWGVANHFQHHGRPGTQMLTLGFDPAKTHQQLQFDFGDSAKDRTINSLVEELPELIRNKYPNGVSLKDLYAGICNETPASKTILGQGLNELCAVDELVKSGAEGEERGDRTKLKDDDIVRPARQSLLFSIPNLRGKP